MADTTMDDEEDGIEEISSHLKITSHRRSNKPLMEKRRRARINSSLGQLKSLVLQAMHKDTSQFTKLEKADILELTVKHMKYVQHQSHKENYTDNAGTLARYHAGFHECTSEVMRYLSGVNNVNHELRSHILNHLGFCLQNSLNHQRQISVDNNIVTSSTGQVIRICGDSIPNKNPGLSFGETISSVTGGSSASTNMPQESMFPHIASNQLLATVSSSEDRTPSVSVKQQLTATISDAHTSDKNNRLNPSQSNLPFRQLLPNVHKFCEKTSALLSSSNQTKLVNTIALGEVPTSTTSLPGLGNTRQQGASIGMGINFSKFQTATNRVLTTTDCKTNVITPTLINRDIVAIAPGKTAATCEDTQHQCKCKITNTCQSATQSLQMQNVQRPSSYSSIISREPVQLISGMLPAGQLAFFIVSPMSMQSPIQAIPIYTSTNVEANKQHDLSATVDMCKPSALNSVDASGNTVRLPEHRTSNKQLTDQGNDISRSSDTYLPKTLLSNDNICRVDANNSLNNKVNVEQNGNDALSCRSGGTGGQIFRPW